MLDIPSYAILAHMEPYALNLIIKEYRERLELTQEDLCDEDIDIRTVQRIESGEVVPQKESLNSIFRRMNMDVPYNLRSITEDEYQLFCIHKKFEMALSARNFNTETLLKQFEGSAYPKDRFNLQLYYLCLGLYKLEICKDFICAKDAFKNSLDKTLKKIAPEYDLEIRHFATTYELNALYGYSYAEYALGEEENSWNHLCVLQNYLEHRKSKPDDKAYLYPEMLLLKAKLLREKENFKEMAELGKLGMLFCFETDSLMYLRDLINLAIEGYSAVGDKENLVECEKILECIRFE